MSRLLSGRFSGFEAYTPGEQPSGAEYIKLNTNESPYPPPPGVAAAVSGYELSKLNLYPEPDGSRLIAKLAGLYGVDRDNIILGNGSDELLAFAFLAYGGDGRGVIFPDITYGFYPVYAELYEIPYTQVPLKDDLSVDIEDYCGATKNIVIANPNAPTGIALSLRDVEMIVKSNPDNIVLIDEAYVDFGAQSAIPLIHKYDNLIVVHTYSKSRSMAGARLAYAIAHAALIEDMNKMKYSFNPYNVNRLTQLMGEAALDDEGYFEDKRQEIIATRGHTAAGLRAMGFEMTESKANFLFARHPGVNGRDLYRSLKDRGILVRHWDKPRISNYVRITIGTLEQMDKLLEAVNGILRNPLVSDT